MAVPFWQEETNAAAYDGPITPSNPWDVCSLGGFDLPGICRVSIQAGMKIDIQKASGRDGAMLIEQGYVPAVVDIELTMWRPEQLTEWESIVNRIWRKSHKPGRADIKKDQAASVAQTDATEKAALALRHPAAQLLNVSAVLIQSIGSPDETQPGFRAVKIKAVEFVSAPARTSTKSATKRTTATKANIDRQIAGDEARAKAAVKRPSSTDRSPKGPPTPPAEGGT